MESLDGISQGRYGVVTASGSQYEVDLDKHTLVRRTRIPADETNQDYVTESLIPLVAVDTCRVHEKALFLIELQVRDTLYTTLSTTAVCSIQDHATEPTLAVDRETKGLPASGDGLSPANG